MPARKPPEQRRSEVRLTRLTPAEAALIRRTAARRRITVAELLRDATLDAIRAA